LSISWTQTAPQHRLWEPIDSEYDELVRKEEQKVEKGMENTCQIANIEFDEKKGIFL